MIEMAEVWQVTLLVDGCTVVDEVTVEPPFGIACADAEVKAIRAHEARGGFGVRAFSSRFLRKVPAADGLPIDSVMAAHFLGCEQARIGAAVRQDRTAPSAPPSECFSRDAWRALTDVEKVDALLKRIGASDQVIVMSRMFAVAPEAGRRAFVESISSVFCTGCGDIQGIDEHGHLDACQCQNDE